MTGKSLVYTAVLLFITTSQSIRIVNAKAPNEQFDRCSLTISKFKDVTVKLNFVFPTNDSGFVQIDPNITFTPASVGYPNGYLYFKGHQFDMATVLKKKNIRTKEADFVMEKYAIHHDNNHPKYYILYFTDQSWSSSIGGNNLMLVIEENSNLPYIYTLGFTPCVNGNNLLYTNGALTFVTLDNKRLILYSLSNGVEKKVNEFKLIEIDGHGCGMYCFKK